MKLLLIAGHGDGDPGACGCGYKEADLTRDLAQNLHTVLKKNEVDVTLYNTNKNAYKECLAGRSRGINFNEYQYCLEIHFNANIKTDYTGDGKMTGTMLYVRDGQPCDVAETILQKLIDVGYKKAWDGIVGNPSQQYAPSGLLVQRKCVEQGCQHAVLETCFISDKDDLNFYFAHKDQTIQAIADALTLHLSGKHKANFIPYNVKVTDPDLNIRSSYGIGNKVVGQIKDQGCYTIIGEGIASEDGAKWGRLKSSAGWINLNYTKQL